VGVRYENSIERFDDPLGKMMNLAAIKENASAERPNVYKEKRVVQETGEEGGLQIVKWFTLFHGR